jgi:hypothetical protein
MSAVKGTMRGGDDESVSTATPSQADNYFSNQSPEGEEKKSSVSGDSAESGENYSKDLEDEFGQFMTKAQVDLVATDAEKIAATKMFADMRADGSFYDVVFLVQGILFRAHRVIVSAWSRYLRSILSLRDDESRVAKFEKSSRENDDVISLDFFTPEAFGAVLDYIYGFPLKFTVEVFFFHILCPFFLFFFFLLTPTNFFPL